MRTLLVGLALLPWTIGCATAPSAKPSSSRPTADGPTLTAPFLAEAATMTRQSDDATADSARLPIGVGFTASPSTILIGAALDFPLDENVTLGPAVQIGYDSDRQIFSPFAQVKYHLPGTWLDESSGQFRMMPYVQAGIGFAYVDKSGRSSDTGLLLNGGAGFRFLTGKSYRLGSEALLNWLPGDVAGEKFYFSWEVLQVVFDF